MILHQIFCKSHCVTCNSHKLHAHLTTFKPPSIYTTRLRLVNRDVTKPNTVTRNVGQCPTWWPPRPAEYRWRPMFNNAKFGWCPILECHAVMLPRRETRRNLQGCPKLTKWSQPIVGRIGSPYCGGHVEEILLLKKFFLTVDTCLSCEDIARQSCAMVPRWQFSASCIFSQPRAEDFRPAF